MKDAHTVEHWWEETPLPTVIHVGNEGASTVTLCPRPADGARLPRACVKTYWAARMRPRHELNLRREVAILTRLRRHGTSGVVRLLRVDARRGAVALHFEACEGGDLHRALRRGPWGEARVRGGVVAPLLRVLAKLHALGVVHRDVKPENIFFDAAGRLVLGDFGLAIDARRERATSVVGTPGYIAPEVLAAAAEFESGGADADSDSGCDVGADADADIAAACKGRYDEKVDVWAVGALVVEALTGALPRDACAGGDDGDDDNGAGAPAAAAKLLAGASAACRDFAARALARDPRRRPSAAELLRHPWILAGDGAPFEPLLPLAPLLHPQHHEQQQQQQQLVWLHPGQVGDALADQGVGAVVGGFSLSPLPVLRAASLCSHSSSGSGDGGDSALDAAAAALADAMVGSFPLSRPLRWPLAPFSFDGSSAASGPAAWSGPIYSSRVDSSSSTINIGSSQQQLPLYAPPTPPLAAEAPKRPESGRVAAWLAGVLRRGAAAGQRSRGGGGAST